MKIDKHLFMVNQPSYPAETESDDYYFNVANRLAEASARVEGIGRWNEAVVARAAVYVVGYYQDVISDAGVWRGFISECRRLYGRTLPFYDTGEEYVDFELNPEDVRFMVWYSLSMLDESRRDLSPLDSFVERLAERWYSILEEGYEEAPLPDEFNIAHGLEVHDPEDAEKLMHLGDWLYKRCWLLAPANTLNMQELVAQLPQKDPGSDEVRNKLKELLDHAINELPTGPLALYLREWIWLTVADRMPPKGRLPKEEGEDHKYYGPFMEATGGERIAFFATYEELNRFFIEALGWTQGEKHLAQLEKESDFVLLIDRHKGLLLAKGVARCIAYPGNPLYDKEYALRHAIELLTVRGRCPHDLMEFVCGGGWLPDARFPGSPDSLIAVENWDFIARCYLQQYYRGD